MIELKALPPKEAIEYFRQKGYQIGFSWEDVWQQEHQAAFTVAKAMQLDLLRDIRSAVDEALANGTTFADFRKNLKPLLVQRGWWGKAEMEDPLTGEKKLVQLGSTRRLKTIFNTNLRTAHSEGQWQRIQASKEAFPYLQYDGNNSEHPRLQHSAWDGMVLPVDDPFWQSHMPIKEWGCKCRVIQINQGMMSRRGLNVSESPDVPKTLYTNKRTGEVQAVPKGVHPAFNYPPGGRLANLPAYITDSVIKAPADLGAAAWNNVGPFVMAGVADKFSTFVDQVFTRGNSNRSFAVAGFMHPDDVSYLAALDRAPASAEIAIPDRLMVGAKATRHQTKGDALSKEEWKALPSLLQHSRAVLYEVDQGNLLYVMDSLEDPRVQKIVVQPDFMTKKPKTRINMARAGFKLSVEDLRAGIKGGSYRVVRGSLE
jgi:hypothetical protein